MIKNYYLCHTIYEHMPKSHDHVKYNNIHIKLVLCAVLTEICNRSLALSIIILVAEMFDHEISPMGIDEETVTTSPSEGVYKY